MTQSTLSVSTKLSYAVFAITLIILSGLSAAFAQQAHGPTIRYPMQFSVSRPVHEMPPQSQAGGPPKEYPLRRPHMRSGSGNIVDPITQTSTPTAAAATSGSQWEGLGESYPGFVVTGVPPDPNMAVGPNHIVQWVNNGFVIFDKQGHEIQAPIDDGTFWGNSTCNQLGGYSDPIVQYDKVADRWLVGEVAIPILPGILGQFAQCFAVSTTSDPTGSYYIWAYGFGTNINDYPKIGMWPDAYYITWNIFDGGGNFTGPEACAWDRSAVIAGASAPALVCFKPSNGYASLLPSDWDGATAPPAGSPNFLMDVDTVSLALHLWKFHVDFVHTANSTFTGPTSLSGVAPFTSPCPTTQDCIAQPGTTQLLDALSDRLMYRLAYRKFSDHESLVANHTVTSASGNTGVRWYEVRSPNNAPFLYQQGTFAPDTDNRWMASAAMDKNGNIAVGYTVASSGTYPSVRYTGWEIGNTLGTLQAESSMVAGGGSQTGYNRWGDYSAMRIDPTDDCTFWYTQEYQASTQVANWNTRIGSFKFSSCGQSKTATSTTLIASPNPSNSGETVTLTATVSPGAATGTLTFYDGANSLGTSAVSGGMASLNTSALSVGSHQLTATYNGDANYSTSTSSAVTQTVNSGSSATTTSLASSSPTSTYGSSVTFTATVSSASATGTVTFKDGATTFGSSNVVAGTASLSTSTLAVGSHQVTAVYSGDANFTGSTSAPLTQTVNKANTTSSITSSLNPSKTRQSVTFKATVSPATATGTVRFLDGTNTLGTVTLSGGTASFSTHGLTEGSHSVKAQYNGDSNYNGSTSSVLTQIVTKK